MAAPPNKPHLLPESERPPAGPPVRIIDPGPGRTVAQAVANEKAAVDAANAAK